MAAFDGEFCGVIGGVSSGPGMFSKSESLVPINFLNLSLHADDNCMLKDVQKLTQRGQVKRLHTT